MSPDKNITAEQLRPGDQIHLRVMGGDEYVEVLHVEIEPDEVEWSGWSPVLGAVRDSVARDDVIRVLVV